MTAPITKAAAFFAAMWVAFIEDGEADGDVLMTELEKSGLAEWRPATAAEAEISQHDVEEGDSILALNADGKAVLAMAGRGGT